MLSSPCKPKKKQIHNPPWWIKFWIGLFILGLYLLKSQNNTRKNGSDLFSRVLNSFINVASFTTTSSASPSEPIHTQFKKKPPLFVDLPISSSRLKTFRFWLILGSQSGMKWIRMLRFRVIFRMGLQSTSPLNALEGSCTTRVNRMCGHSGSRFLKSWWEEHHSNTLKVNNSLPRKIWKIIGLEPCVVVLLSLSSLFFRCSLTVVAGSRWKASG